MFYGSKTHGPSPWQKQLPFKSPSEMCMCLLLTVPKMLQQHRIQLLSRLKTPPTQFSSFSLRSVEIRQPSQRLLHESGCRDWTRWAPFPLGAQCLPGGQMTFSARVTSGEGNDELFQRLTGRQNQPERQREFSH